MSNKKYLYQKSSGEWIFGPTKNSICPSGIYRLVVETNGSLTIRHIYNRDITYQYAQSYSDFLKENNTPYASLNELLAATLDFFSGTIAVIDSTVKNSIDTLRSKQFAENGIHFLSGTDPAPDGIYSGFIVTGSSTVINSIDYIDDTKIGGNITDITLVQGMYYPIPGGFSTLTLSSGDMILVR